MLKKMLKNICILSRVIVRLCYKPAHLIRFMRIFKNEGLNALKGEMLAFIRNRQSYSTRQEFGRLLFEREQSEYADLSADAQTLQYQPLVSLILPTYKTPLKWLKKCIESVQNQVYPHWQLCIVDDASHDPALTAYLSKCAKQDHRIICEVLQENGGISKASNRALDLASGEFIALLDHDDELTPDALFWIAARLNQDPDLDYLYSNECKVDEKGRTSFFILKPDWSPEFLLNSMYTGHLSVYRKSRVDELGRFRSEYDFSQDYDLALRVTEITQAIAHVDRVLYLWRSIEGSAAAGGKDFARISNLAALRDAARRRGLSAEVLALPYANRLKLNLPYADKVSIIIPSDNLDHIKSAVDALFAATDYPDYEVLVVTKTALAQELDAMLSAEPRLKFCTYDRPYNFSDKCNVGAGHATGEILVFYNDDVFPIENNWLKNLIEYLYVEGVGGVSPKLLYLDKRIQYAGMYNGVREYDFTATVHIPLTDQDYYTHYSDLVSNTGILSGACVALRKPLFDEIGGFDVVNTPARHSDLDLSFKIRERGLRCVYTPYATLWHVGNHSWRNRKQDKSVIYCMARWGAYMAHDPYVTENMHALLRLQDPQGFHIEASNRPRFKSNRPCILLVSHELSNTGAPRALYLLARALHQEYALTLISPITGPLQRLFAIMDIPVVIDHSLFTEQHATAQQFARDFDLVIANTICAAPFVNALYQETLVLWWIHEGQDMQTYLERNKPYQACLQGCQHVYTVSEYVKARVKPYYPEIKIIPLGIPDEKNDALDIEAPSKNKVVFTLVGALCPRKGQDLLISAIKLLPKSYQHRAEFNLLGGIHGLDFFKALQQAMKTLDCVKHRGPANHAQVIEKLNASDAMICLSRDEPFSIVCIESWMLGKPTIVAKTVGASHYVENGKNGFVVDIENLQGIAEVLKSIIDDPNCLALMAESARNTYLDHFTYEKFAAAWQAEIKNIITN